MAKSYKKCVAKIHLALKKGQIDEPQSHAILAIMEDMIKDAGGDVDKIVMRMDRGIEEALFYLKSKERSDYYNLLAYSKIQNYIGDNAKDKEIVTSKVKEGEKKFESDDDKIARENLEQEKKLNEQKRLAKEEIPSEKVIQDETPSKSDEQRIDDEKARLEEEREPWKVSEKESKELATSFPEVKELGTFDSNHPPVSVTDSTIGTRNASKDNSYLRLLALLDGVMQPIPKGLRSTGALQKQLTVDYWGRLVNLLEQAGVFKAFQSGPNMDGLVARELWEIRPGGKLGVTGNTDARKIAEVIWIVKESLVKRINRWGGDVNLIEGHIFVQSHDMRKIQKAGYNKWANEIYPLLDKKKTFTDNNHDDFLKTIYDAFSTGQHMKYVRDVKKDDDYFKTIFSSRRNVANKLAGRRVIFFKDASSSMLYNDKFGSGSLPDNIVFNIENMAHSLALMQVWGPNPKETFEKVLLNLTKETKNSDPESFKGLTGKFIQDLWLEISGENRIPVNLTSARIAMILRAVQTTSKLGMAVISSFPDVVSVGFALRNQGWKLFDVYQKSLPNLFKGRGNAETRRIANSIGAGLEGIINSAVNRISSADSLPGRTAKYLQLFFKLNLMSIWNDTNRTWMAMMMATRLVDSRYLKFSDLNTKWRRVLEQYGFGELEWDLIRKHGVSLINGKAFILSEGVDLIPDEVISKYVRTKTGQKSVDNSVIGQTRDEISSMVGMYYTNQLDSGVPMPGATERAFMNHGTRPGTIIGEALRFLMQFKSFPLTILRKGVFREYRNNDIVGLIGFSAAMTLAGYYVIQMKSAVLGKTYRHFTGDWEVNMRLVADSMVHGGGFGLLGDTLLGNWTPGQNTFLKSAAGPTIGQLDDVASLFSRARQFKDIKPQLFKMGLNNTPFINLFYARMVMDYLFIFQMKELLSPGYLKKYEKWHKQVYDQELRIEPTEIIRFGGKSRY